MSISNRVDRVAVDVADAADAIRTGNDIDLITGVRKGSQLAFESCPGSLIVIG